MSEYRGGKRWHTFVVYVAFRTWFCFGVMRDPAYPTVKSCHTVRLTVRNLNKQSKLFSQGMVPVYVTQTAKKVSRLVTILPCTLTGQMSYLGDVDKQSASVYNWVPEVGKIA